MQIIGILLIIGVIFLLVAYFKWSRQEAVTQESNAGLQKVTVIVSGAYSPNIIRAKTGNPLTIVFDRREDNECSKKVIIADFGIVQKLADFSKTEVEFTPDKTGEFSFTCEMGMYQGKLIVEK